MRWVGIPLKVLLYLDALQDTSPYNIISYHSCFKTTTAELYRDGISAYFYYMGDEASVHPVEKKTKKQSIFLLGLFSRRHKV